LKLDVDGKIIELVMGDITDEQTDAIVNAANTSLLGGGGVDGAIHRRGGPAILEECRKLHGCKTGDAKITTAGNLKCKYVMHTVGPVYRDGAGGEDKLLESAYRRSLEVATENGVSSISFPSISTGRYRYPALEAARIALGTAVEYLRNHSQPELVRFVLFDTLMLRAYEDAIKGIG